MSRKKGFTLVELIVVIVIILVLAAVLVPSLLKYVSKARQAKYANDANQIVRCVQYAETEFANNSVLNGGTDYDLAEGIGNIRINNIKKNGSFTAEALYCRKTGATNNATDKKALLTPLVKMIQEKVSLSEVAYISLFFDMSGNLVQNSPRSDGQKNYYGQGAQTIIRFQDGTTLVYHDEGGWKIQ